MRSKLKTSAILAMLLAIAGCRLFTSDGAACRGIANCPDRQWCCAGSCREPRSCTLSCNANADCPGGYMCHPSDLACVPALRLDCAAENGTCPADVHPGDPCPSKGSFVPCTNEGGLDCKDGCRTCGDDLTWGTCCDGEIDEDCPTPCTPSSVTCDTDGRTLQTCNTNGYGYNAAIAVVCPYLCGGTACITPSNVPTDELTACDDSAPSLTPPSGASLTLDTSALTCSPTCDGVSNASIPLQTVAVTPPFAILCVSRLSIPAGVTLAVSVAITPAIAIIVDGDATVNGAIDFSGRPGPNNAPLNIAGGRGGPGGGAGATGCPNSSCSGSIGNGPGGGSGGERDTSVENAGGGGGAGYLGVGGKGGDGTLVPTPGSPGGTGGVTYGPFTLVPLEGGSGGGSGGDGTPLTGSGPGGGGGGALEILARGVLTLTGSITADGGAGGDQVAKTHGAGGGGSGGAILLEAPTMVLLGDVSVNGGMGGTGGAGDGGFGATGTNVDGDPGADAMDELDGGAGGGGGSGRIRINRIAGSTCADLIVTPTSACTDGSLP